MARAPAAPGPASGWSRKGRPGRLPGRDPVQGHLRVGVAAYGDRPAGRGRLGPQPGGPGVRSVRDAACALRQGGARAAGAAAQRAFGDGVGGRGRRGLRGERPPSFRVRRSPGAVGDRARRADQAVGDQRPVRRLPRRSGAAPGAFAALAAAELELAQDGPRPGQALVGHNHDGRFSVQRLSAELTGLSPLPHPVLLTTIAQPAPNIVVNRPARSSPASNPTRRGRARRDRARASAPPEPTPPMNDAPFPKRRRSPPLRSRIRVYCVIRQPGTPKHRHLRCAATVVLLSLHTETIRLAASMLQTATDSPGP